jgi:serine protease Do
MAAHTVLAAVAQDRAAAVRNDLTNVAAAGGWIYNDLPKAFSEAAKTRKPMLVVFRCVP